MKISRWIAAALAVVLVAATWAIVVADGPGAGPAAQEVRKPTPPKAQTTCPVMGGKINREIFVDHDGKRVYLCCKGCIEAFKKAPEKYIKKLEADGVELEKTPAPKKNAPAKGPCCGGCQL